MYYNVELKKVGKLLIAFCCALMAFNFVACSNQDQSSDVSKLEFEDATELLTNIWDRENINDKPNMVFGGIGETMVEEKPGAVDIAQKDSIEGVLYVPMDLANSSTSGACVMNAIMANDFTASAWQLKDDVDVDALQTQIEEKLKSAQWLCTFPEEYDIAVQDGFVVVVYGKTAQVQPFVEAAKQVMANAEVTTGQFEA